MDSKKMEVAQGSLFRLGLWRSIFSGWQLGNRPPTDPESQAVNDLRHLVLTMKAEINAIQTVLINKGICNSEEMLVQMGIEAENIMRGLEERFPGAKAGNDCIILDMEKWAETTKEWKK